ncbi:E3 ubiquitin-protein ligase RNF123-like [Ruditapes philippinarum]|uniref:E3 ubiquitin-protein ligase RNF123-like n=1 Tax=Ruditapes philippinarum TaxID=129788 RepID=UPI00295C197E|nr:E3 ubiquitin-protein ligase RNF123-like [Ruditapes philippinarum]
MSKTASQASRPCSKAEHVQLLSVSKTSDSFAADVISKVFPSAELASEASADAGSKVVTVSNLGSHLEKWTEDAVKGQQITDTSEPVEGRLGPVDVTFQFDIHTNVGTLIVDQDRLGLSSQSNFSSMKANCCVYRGKWAYEVMLGSKGVMQIGWCTIKCKFSQEEGVGDTEDSYAYDGSRQRKWNKTTQKYGEAWCTGDVITCTIDCDTGSICFYRNGKSLGEAFSCVRLGPGYAYFPAVSLSLGESLRANFGATPLRYPVPGYSPLQSSPVTDVVKTNILLSYIEKLLKIHMEVVEVPKSPDKEMLSKEKKPAPLTETRSKESSVLLIVAQVFDKLAPYLRNTYVTEACLLKLVLRLNDVTMATSHQPIISKLLDYMWAFMQGFEVRGCVENLMVSLLSSYRYTPTTTDFRNNRQYLILVLAVLRHQQTRRYLLEHELFDKVKFPMFLHIKPLDDAGLQQLSPTVWWDMTSQDDEPDETVSEEEQRNKDLYTQSVDVLRERIEEIEQIQVELLKVLLNHRDLADGKTSRQLFLEKFRKFIRENKPNSLTLWPMPVTLCFFHRMVQALRYYWDDFQKEDPARFVFSSEAFMPIQEFWSDSRDSYDVQRCGGSMSHLNRMLGFEVNKAQGLQLCQDGEVKPLEKSKSASIEYPSTEMPSGNTLMELLDGVMMLYHIAAHKQLGKMNVLKEHIQEYIQSYKDTLKKLDCCPIEMDDVRDELIRAKSVFLEKITEQARQICWVRAVIYSKQKQLDVAWLLKSALKTVSKASEYKLLFQYMPEFYLDIVIYSHNALKNFFHPYMLFESLPDYDELIKGFATFLVSHFADSRIVVTDTRDNIIQALACFTCYEKSLKVLESLPVEKCQHMLKALISPYENRSWAQTNWILVRIWKGCGFGFRYTHLPHLVPSKVQLTEFGSASLQKPCPSPKFQSLLGDILRSEPEAATRFIDTLLNQLNWSFSEFIGMMQEIQTIISRTERKIFIESRQLKICGTCFEISVCLFRVVEMVVAIAPTLFTDWTKPSAELLMHRLIQLVCLVLNRITQKDGMFDSVVSLYITGLESVTHYPMLSVIAGILTMLIVNADTECQELVTNVLLADHGFQITALEFMLNNHDDKEKGAVGGVKPLKEKQFDFRNYEEVNEEEIGNVETLISHLRDKQSTFVRQDSEIKDEDLCQICYARKETTGFKPCGHQSCRSCINHQMLIKKECFFCKAVITSIEDLQSTTKV